MSTRGKHPVGRIVRAIRIPTNEQVVACELMMPIEHEGSQYGRGYYAILDGEDVVQVMEFQVFRRAYHPICTWREYDAGWSDDDTNG